MQFAHLHKELNDLRFDEEHLVEIRRTPFWQMFKSIYQSDTTKLMRRCYKHETNIRELMLTFDHHAEKFVVMVNSRRLQENNNSKHCLVFGRKNKMGLRCLLKWMDIRIHSSGICRITIQAMQG
ncbi:hypothetical protein ACS0TY_028074 [Phlomoides rotata]